MLKEKKVVNSQLVEYMDWIFLLDHTPCILRSAGLPQVWTFDV